MWRGCCTRWTAQRRARRQSRSWSPSGAQQRAGAGPEPDVAASAAGWCLATAASCATAWPLATGASWAHRMCPARLLLLAQLKPHDRPTPQPLPPAQTGAGRWSARRGSASQRKRLPLGGPWQHVRPASGARTCGTLTPWVQSWRHPLPRPVPDPTMTRWMRSTHFADSLYASLIAPFSSMHLQLPQSTGRLASW